MSGQHVGSRRPQLVLAIGLLVAASVPVTLAAEAPSPSHVRARAATEISGAIAVDATWRKADSPVVLTGQTIVNPGATLTIEPGVEVRVRRGASLVVRGGLVASGTAEAPISIAGDDGVAGSWPGIEALGGTDPARIALRHTTVAHGGGSGGRGAQLYGYIADLDLEDVTVRDGAGVGVLVESAGLRMLRVAITGNAETALWVTGLHTADPAYVPQLEAITLTGNGSDVIRLDGPGGFSADTTLRDLGVPYEIHGQLTVANGATIRIDPGTEIRFAASSEFVVGGQIEAAGTTQAPIVLRGVGDASGSWYGVAVIGGQVPAVGRFEHVTIRSAGQSGRPALRVANAQVSFIGGGVTDSAGDGIIIDGGNGGTSRIEGAAIVGIAGIGLRNDSSAIVLAQHDWWGDASGPTSTGSCSGTGSTVEGKVRFAPWLTAADEPPDPFAVARVPTISLEPQRWYAPADRQTRVWIDMTVRDPLGRPLVGRTVDLRTTLGAIVHGSPTDAAGHTLAYLTSDQPGDARVSATLVSDDPCELDDPVETLISFREIDDDYLVGVDAPYLVDGLEFDPEPVVLGVPTTLRARLQNTSSEPIRVEAEFGYASFGIGLTFGPIGDLVVHEIPAGGELAFETTWVPPISGHYCLQVLYRILGPGEATGVSRAFAAVGWPPGWNGGWIEATGGTGSGGDNQSTRGGGAPALRQFGGAPAPPNRDGANKVVGGLKSMGFGSADQINKSMWGDPPRQDYTIVAPVERLPVTYWPRESGWSDARWAAEQALADAIFEYTAIGRAAIVSLDRYGGAAAANELYWAAVQASSIIHYRKELGTQALALADKVAALASVIERESPDEGLTLEAARAELERLRTSGLTAEERAFILATGLDDAAVAGTLAWALEQSPAGLAGRTVDQLRKVEAYYREVSSWYAATGMFPENGPTAANGTQFAAAGSSELALIVDETVPFEVGNPLDHEATIVFRVRPIALPAGWTATVSPPEMTLAPGARTTATVTISPSGPTIQGTIVKVAVEGMVGDDLLGGVVVGVVVPEYVPFEAPVPAMQDNLLPVALAGAAAVALIVVFAIVLLVRRRQARLTA